MGGLKSEVGSLNVKVDNIESDMGDLKSEVGGLKPEVGSLRTEMHSRFNHVDDLLEGIGGQFGHQTNLRIADGQTISKKELTSMKVRIFDLESKTR